jgi:hypothetical protein
MQLITRNHKWKLGWPERLARRLLVISLATSFVAAFDTGFARAFDLFPEFHALSESESAHPPNAKRIDSEYQSDVLTYLTPLSWDARFFVSANAFDITTGSLSNQFFLERSRLKAAKRLSDSLAFRFTYFAQRDHDLDQTHSVLELVYPLSPEVSVSIYGEPSFFKRENDFGAALLWTPQEGHEIRFFHTWIDLTRELHNDRGDYFVRDKSPTSLGLVGRCSGCLTGERDERDWLEYFVRWETPTEWRLADEGRAYQAELATAGVFARRPLTSASTLNLRLQTTKRQTGNAAYGASPISSAQVLDNRIYEALASLETERRSSSGKQFLFEPGLGWVKRQWIDQNGQSLEHRNMQVFAWAHFPAHARVHGPSDRLSFGYETTFFSSEGAQTLAAEELKAWAVEHRVNLRYEIAFAEGASLGLTVSGDVDSAVRGSGGLFEGGHVWFRTPL